MADQFVVAGEALAATASGRIDPKPPSRLRAFAAPLFVFLVALAPRLLHLGRSPHRDELFHVLAAQSLLAEGTLVIDDGGVPYTRARPFTYLVAGLFRLFGESLIVARLPGVLAMAAVVALVFLWVRKAVGKEAAWAAALLLCFDPAAIFYSQLGRFYGLHALLFFLGAFLVYHATTSESRSPRLVVAGALAVLALGLACFLQITTVMGITALLLWLGVVIGPGLARRVPAGRRRHAVISISLLIAALLALLVASGAMEYLLERYSDTDLWAEGRARDPLFYHRRLAFGYPTLWSLFPVIVFAGLVATPRLAGFSTVLFGAVFVFSSLGAQKHERYLLFVMPFFFILCGIAVGKVIPWLTRSLETMLSRWRRLKARPHLIEILAGVMVAGTFLFALGSNRAPVTTARMLATRDADDSVYGWQPNWIAARPTLHSLADSTTLVLSSWPLAAWYYLDRLDVSLHARELSVHDPLPEFTVPAWYLPRPTISEPESLGRLVDCAPSGLVIIERGHWRTPWVVSTDMADYISEHLERASLPERWGLLVFRWGRGSGASARPCRDVLGEGSPTRS